jgi:hypothetical protein
MVILFAVVMPAGIVAGLADFSMNLTGGARAMRTGGGREKIRGETPQVCLRVNRKS